MPALYPVRDIGQFFRIKHGYAFKGEHFVDSGSHILLTPGNFEASGGLKLKGDKEKYYDGEIPPAFVLRRGDLVIAMTDLTQNAPILGAPAFIPEDDRFLHNQRLGKVVDVAADQIDVRYLYYLLNTRAVREQIKATATGATVRHTAPDRIYAARAPMPPLPAQHRIADILSAYDDLIENNARRIKILEEMARSLYREWFVELRAADGVRTGKSSLPPGWRPATLGDLVDEVRDAVDPKDIDPETPYFGLEHLPRRSTTLFAWGTAAEVQSQKLRVEKGDVLFGKIRPYFHKVGLSPVQAVASSDAIVLRPRRDDVRALALACASSDELVARATAASQGTKMPRASWDVMSRFPVPVPPADQLGRFNGVTGSAFDLAATLGLKNRALAAARDLLLPLLISGEIELAP